MRVMVTGATGFLGGVLTRRLMEQGHAVTALGRDRDKLAKLAAAGAITHAIDLGDPSASLPSVSCDAVVHCAALSSPWGRDADFVRANVTGTQTALSLAQTAGAQRFVHISTPSIYFRFRDQLGVREDAPLPPPVNAYARTKRAAEQLVMAVTQLDPVILRPRGLYGPGDTALLPRLLNAARRRALPLMNHGRAATDLTYVADVADAAIAALNASPQPSQRVFNISGGEALNVRELVGKVSARAGVAIRWRPAPRPLVLAYARASDLLAKLKPDVEPPVTAYSAGLFAFSQTLDISAARAGLGWAPRVRFEDGLERTFAGEAA